MKHDHKNVAVFATRKIARNVARARMRGAGAVQINKEKFGIRGQMIVKLPSFFSARWRDYATN